MECLFQYLTFKNENRDKNPTSKMRLWPVEYSNALQQETFIFEGKGQTNKITSNRQTEP